MSEWGKCEVGGTGRKREWKEAWREGKEKWRVKRRGENVMKEEEEERWRENRRCRHNYYCMNNHVHRTLLENT